MSHSAVAGARRYLVNQLIYFDEQSHLFLDTYFPDKTKDRTDMHNRIERYSQVLETLLRAEDSQLAHSLHEIAVLGSSVVVEYEEEGCCETFTLVFPTDVDLEANKISLLSPIGKQLLMRKKGDSFLMDTPSAPHRINIVDLKLTSLNDITG
jgi:transcription elongation GreA/GreB family factor